MPRKQAASPHTELRKLIPAALKNATKGGTALEKYLTENSGLPGPRMNLALVDAFADVIGEIVSEPDPPEAQLEALLDGWAALTVEDAPTDDPREILPAAAVMSYGQAAVSRPEWWEDEIEKLHKAAADPRWRIHEMVAAALQRMLLADWERASEALYRWLHEDNPLIVRAAIAAVAEPKLLTDETRGMNALSMQAIAAGCLLRLPAEDRRDEAARTLRQALGYTLSVAVTAVPDAGFSLLERLAVSGDKDARWIVRENLKKARLKTWPERVEALQTLLAE
jgi:hypothetical protein